MGGTLEAVTAAFVDPRIERSREQVLVAAVDLLREVGFGALTIEAVAARSGVAKSTIYRHWSSKAEVVADAFLWAHRHDPPVDPPPGPVRERVVAVLQATIGDMATADRLACMMPAIIDAAARSDEIAALTRQLSEEKAARLRKVLDEAVTSGELAESTDTAVLADALLGPVLLRSLFHRDQVAAEDVPALVDQVLSVTDPARAPVSP
jgi:TetR/AcrR family transcriptional regulator, regulator of autoinduction and epiphytic fitness